MVDCPVAIEFALDGRSHTQGLPSRNLKSCHRPPLLRPTRSDAHSSFIPLVRPLLMSGRSVAKAEATAFRSSSFEIKDACETHKEREKNPGPTFASFDPFARPQRFSSAPQSCRDHLQRHDHSDRAAPKVYAGKFVAHEMDRRNALCSAFVYEAPASSRATFASIAHEFQIKLRPNSRILAEGSDP